MASESRKQFKERLLLEGRWVEYVERRENLKAQGLPPAEAHARIFRDYPPLSAPELKAKALEAAGIQAGIQTKVVSAGKESDPRFLKALAEAIEPQVTKEMFAEKPEPNETEVIRWVFENLAIDNLKPEDAPSAGAWGFLQEVKASHVLRTEFFKGIWPRLLPTKTTLEQHERFKDDGRDLIALIERVKIIGDKNGSTAS